VAAEVARQGESAKPLPPDGGPDSIPQLQATHGMAPKPALKSLMQRLHPVLEGEVALHVALDSGTNCPGADSTLSLRNAGNQQRGHENQRETS
jgi:hypothetical protein